MRRAVCVVFGVGLLAVLAGLAYRSAGAADQPAKDQRVFELRTYTTNPGKLDALHKRFREHTNRIFKKHGVEIIGYWTPAEGPQSQDTLIYVVAFPSREAQKKAWAAFQADPEWQKVKEESHKDGVIVKEVKSITMRATDYSPIR
jgi:hypothetical protein